MSEAVESPKFRGTWSPSVAAPVVQNFAVPMPKKVIEKKEEPIIEETPPIKEEEIEEESEEQVVEEENEEKEEIKEEPVKEEPIKEIIEDIPIRKPVKTAVEYIPPTETKSLTRQPSKPKYPSVSRRIVRTPPPLVKTKKHDPKTDEVLSNMVKHLTMEKEEIHERELAREFQQFRESTNDRAVQRQLDTIQFQITSQINLQKQQEQQEALRQQQRKRRREMLQRMILDLQTELDAELEMENQFQEQRKAQREQTIDDFKKWNGEIERIRDRLEKSSDAKKLERKKEEKQDSVQLGRVQKLYYETLNEQNPDAAKHRMNVTAATKVEPYQPRKVVRRGKVTTNYGSEALNRLLDRMQGLESDSDSEED